MSLKREMLIEAGIEDKGVLDNIMQAYGAGIENAKTQAKQELEAENTTLKERLEAQETKVAELLSANKDSEDAKKALADLQEEFANYKTDSDNKLASIQKRNAIALALKDTKAHDSEVLMKLIDIDSIELDDNGKPKLEDTINQLKEEKPFLFENEQNPQPIITVGGNPEGTGSNDNDPFQDIINSYGK